MSNNKIQFHKDIKKEVGMHLQMKKRNLRMIKDKDLVVNIPKINIQIVSRYFIYELLLIQNMEEELERKGRIKTKFIMKKEMKGEKQLLIL